MGKAQNETEKLQETIDDLKKRLEAAEAKLANVESATYVPGFYSPGDNEQYYTIDSGRVSYCHNWTQEHTDYALGAGICFKTKQETEDFLNWLKAYAVLREDAKGYNPGCDFDDCYYYVYVDDGGDVMADDCSYGKCDLICFEKEEDAKKSAKEHAAEWKIFYGIK